MTKILASTIFVAALIFGSIQPAFAQDVYIETYSDGCDIYIVTESIDTNGIDYANVTLKHVENGKLKLISHVNYVYVEYRNDIWQGYWEMSTVEGRKAGAKSIKIWKPTEDKVLMYCLNYR